MKRLMCALSLPVLMLLASPAAAAQYGSADEAKAMLARAAAAVKQDQATALKMFTMGDGGFKDRDLYPYCGGPDGTFTAHPTLIGKSLQGLKDKTGKAFGQEIYDMAADGAIAEVVYMWPRPGSDEPVEKIAYVTKVGDQICAVGFYK